jgi:hypothetical protein
MCVALACAQCAESRSFGPCFGWCGKAARDRWPNEDCPAPGTGLYSPRRPPGCLPGHHGELPPRAHRVAARGAFSFQRLSTGRAGLLSAFDPAEMASATKSNSSTHAIALKQRCLITPRHLAPLGGLDLNLMEFEPRLCPCRGFSWATVTKIDDILMFCCVSGFFAGVLVAVATLPG